MAQSEFLSPNQQRLKDTKVFWQQLVDIQWHLNLAINKAAELKLPASAARLVTTIDSLREATNFTSNAIILLKKRMIAAGENFEE